MDCLEFESITGFRNYEGFKSALKNSIRLSNYSISDKTIVFNRVVTFRSDGNQTFTLDNNQVGILLNVSQTSDNLGHSDKLDMFEYYDLNGDQIITYSNTLINGVYFTIEMSPSKVYGSGFTGMTFAIFDLY